MTNMRGVAWTMALVAAVATAETTPRPQSIAFSWPENDNKKNYDETMDPLTQNIPLDAASSSLRPPPPRVPDVFDIFVGLSTFRDGYRCGYTLFTGFTRATHPDRVYFGVVDQVNPEDVRCLDAYCAFAKEQWPEDECKYKSHIKIDERLADDSRGPTYARHHQQKLVGDQEFCLQLDAHSIFTKKWDEGLVGEWKATNNEMAVLSTYLHHCHDGYILPDGTNNPPDQLPHLCTTIRGGNGCVRTVGASMIQRPKYPQLSALWGAGLSFSKCHAETRVRVDPHTLWMFDGEEFLRASHLWTYGYDMYSPSTAVDVELKKREEEMGVNRFKLMVGQPFKGLVDTEEWDMYKFGSVRSFSEYLRFSGITFADGKTDEHSCKQLHWVPYEKPAEIESMLPGWHLHRSGHENSPENGQVAEATTTAVTAPNVRQEKPVNFGIEATIEHPERVTYSGSLAFMGFGIVLFGVVYT
ncbi:hypothetical protein DYB37_010233 [Aphanomyces astaci]|uniref:Glycosyltransferase 2-like domain-containing protein n=1 Tax=Aphanomyces astaci TaxID=112090 RepID=A0A3R6X1K7_APHAT|nr:hypothetical protein DYB35_009775 [Aphanomyces astaci]RHZ06628.1 hypothetical protein DYB37_010233 [Aphanomyces astaci]